MNLQFALDMETMGQSIFVSPVINVSYVIFDWDVFTSDTPYTFKQLIEMMQFAKIDVAEQCKMGCRFTKDDLKFWEDLPPEARKQAKPSADDISVKKFVSDLSSYIGNKNIKRWWSRANCYDPVILQRMFDEVSSNAALNNVLPFWKVRDIRTYIDTRFDFKLKKNSFCPIDDEALWDQYFIQHNSTHDVAADILRMQKIERAIHCD